MERVLADIDADYGNRTLCCRGHGVLLVLAPLASLSLAGQEHGRTIPLAVIGLAEFPERQLRNLPSGLAELFHLDARLLEDRPPSLDFRLVEGAERLRRLLLARRDLHAKVREPRAHCRVG